jgi:hypothetical protein
VQIGTIIASLAVDRFFICFSFIIIFRIKSNFPVTGFGKGANSNNEDLHFARNANHTGYRVAKNLFYLGARNLRIILETFWEREYEHY